MLLGAYAGLLRPVVLRPFFVYGEGQRRMLVARLAEQIQAGEEIVVEGDPGLRCNPVHVDDMVRVFEPVLTAPVSGVINVAGPDVVSMSELVAALGQAIGIEPVVRHRPAATAGDLVAATGRMRSDAGRDAARGAPRRAYAASPPGSRSPGRSRPHADPGVADVEVVDRQPELVAPATDLVLGVPRCVRRVVPVEVDEVVEVGREVVVPEALRKCQ